MTPAAGFAALRRLLEPPPGPAAEPAGGPVAGPVGGQAAEPVGGAEPAPSEPQPSEAQPSEAQRCELCGEPAQPGHRHLLDLPARALRCACRPCALLFDHRGAGGGRYRLVPDRRWHLHDLVLDEDQWERLRIPVHLAFFFHDSAAGRVVAFYPSPGGVVESLLGMAAWAEIEARNPVLGELERDVEALLVNRVPDAASHWLVPVDDCYRLAGLIRAGWKGLGGGREVRDAITRFFADLRAKARTVSRDGTRASGARPVVTKELA